MPQKTVTPYVKLYDDPSWRLIVGDLPFASMDELKIGVIGGSGLGEAFMAASHGNCREADTPFGRPSDALVETQWAGVPVVFLARSKMINANAAITNTAVSLIDNAAPRKIAVRMTQPAVCSFHQRVSAYIASVTNKASAMSIYPLDAT